MALTSPGVEVSIVDQSQYLPAPTNSIPFVLLATAENKANPTGTGIAQATTAANAGKLYRVTSQRDLVTLYGNPFFYTTSAGTPIQGYELNEYGLLAAYSALGISNSVYVLRADIDLASLVGSTGRPTANPVDQQYWLNTTTSTWGINEFNATTGLFTAKTPIVLSDATLINGSGVPLSTVGQIGDYCVVAYDVSINATLTPTSSTASMYYYKNYLNTWVGIGTPDWIKSWPVATGSISSPVLTAADQFTLTLNGVSTATITIAASPNNTIAQVAADINALGWNYISASVVNNKLNIYSAQLGGSTANAPFTVQLAEVGAGTAVADMGFATTAYNQGRIFWGTSANQPLWQSGQTNPAPTGSVWIKVNGTGLQPVVSEWDSATSNWLTRNLTFATDDWNQIGTSDSTGGGAITAGSVYAQYRPNNDMNWGPVYLWRRRSTGATLVKGTNLTPDFTSGPYVASVSVSIPASTSLSSSYAFNLADATDASDFVTAWSAAGIPNTLAVVNTDGSISLSHTKGGVIQLDDYDATTGISSGLWVEAGFTSGTTIGTKWGDWTLNNNFTPATTGGTGTNFVPSITNYYTWYDFDPDTFTNAGTGYTLGDQITVAGTSLGGTSPANDLVLEVTGVNAGAVTAITWVSGYGSEMYTTLLSNWVAFESTGANSIVSNEGAPTAIPTNLTNWFYSATDQVDLMVNYNGAWRGYKNQGYDSNGFPAPNIANATDPLGPIISATAPITQSDLTALVYGDLWIDTSDLENYPIIRRWQSVTNVDQWVLIDNTDQTSGSGVLFADARWATNGTTNPANDPIPTIVSLLSSNNLDVDAPTSTLSPTGMLLWNSRRSGYNVKQYRVNYFNADRFPSPAVLPTQKDAWVTASGLQSDGSPYMGRKAQRAMVVQSLKSVIDSNTAIRDEDFFFNTQATPNYPELQPNMVVLNADRGETSYIIGDTPMRLRDSATEIQAWATNTAGATATGEAGLVTRNTYMGLFYPSGIATDLSGNSVAVPSSHMMIRTFLRNDNVAYPWLAPAGTRRGLIDNATNIGYLDAATGEFQTIRTRVGIRDVLYENFINPMVFFTGTGLLNYGNKSSFNSSSALDRINVARLVAYIRRQLILAARPFVFEPNDPITRQQIAGVVETLFIDLVAKRGLYDYSVVCDESNNTPARIDRNELWIDIAVEPVKAAEFIYIPVRIFNTGELSGS